jgi:predicted phage terminase large subunit-like protein
MARAKKLTAAEQLDIELKLAKRMRAVLLSRGSLIELAKLLMPDPEDVDDVEKSLYQITPQAKLLCEVLEKVERGELLRVCVSIGPQLGKSQLISRVFPAWFMGKNPYKHFMLGTYNQDFANDFGGEVREICTSSTFRQVFPDFKFRTGSRAKDAMVTNRGGKLAFLGRGGAGTGKPADCFVIDDPLKDAKEAESPTIRRDLWEWFNKVTFTRCHVGSAIVIVHTRWSEDDLIGRLMDPAHPDHDPEIAKRWTYVNLPAVVKDQALADALGLTLEMPTDPQVIKQFGAQPMSALWPQRKPLRFLAEARSMDPRGFEALYMGNPAPEDGDFFKREWLVPYKPEELPRNLMKYSTSDHAISTAEDRDMSCFLTGGVDHEGVLWILPDIYWAREDDTNVIVDEMLDMMRRHRPLYWWAERGHISKSILPFLRKRMVEEKVLETVVDDSMVPSTDKKTRARSVQGMMSLKQVRFPVFAPWWGDAQNELLKFPNATHDDFVDALSWLGIGLMQQTRAARPRPDNQKVVPIGSIAWIKNRSRFDEAAERRRKALGGM